MLVRLGYVAMSVYLQNASPSQTMTHTQFQKLKNREAAIHKLERISISNLQNCLRLLKHNKAHDISVFRFSSKLIPLANHEDLLDWDFMDGLEDTLEELGEYIKESGIRVDFHPDHFVLLNSPKADILQNSIQTLRMHRALLRGMGMLSAHRCVLHIGGGYSNKEKSLEQFITNWASVPKAIQNMVILENDDTTFNITDTLYLGEKLGIPVVFDYHHHLINPSECDWEEEWERVLNTWKISKLPVKMHISSPKEGKNPRAHADYIDKDMFLTFLRKIKDSTIEIDCMIEAKMKDDALFRLMKELREEEDVEIIDKASFYIK